MNEQRYRQVVVNPGRKGQIWDGGDRWFTLREWKRLVSEREGIRVWKVLPLQMDVEEW